MQIERRSLITGLISLIAAPAIVRATSLMPVKVFDPVYYWRIDGYDEYGFPVSELLPPNREKWSRVFSGETAIRRIEAIWSPPEAGGFSFTKTPVNLDCRPIDELTFDNWDSDTQQWKKLAKFETHRYGYE